MPTLVDLHGLPSEAVARLLVDAGARTLRRATYDGRPGHPVMLGRGKRVFGDDAQPSAFTLVHSISTPSGVLLTRYARSGEVRTGRFED